MSVDGVAVQPNAEVAEQAADRLVLADEITISRRPVHHPVEGPMPTGFVWLAECVVDGQKFGAWSVLGPILAVKSLRRAVNE